jgi:hypothetical protein
MAGADMSLYFITQLKNSINQCPRLMDPPDLLFYRLLPGFGFDLDGNRVDYLQYLVLIK